MASKIKDISYHGFEQGPIRPPSEAYSLLIRVTRNCPWNHCAFCSVYKGSRFSIRPVDHVKQDIDEVYRHVRSILDLADPEGNISSEKIRSHLGNIMAWDMGPFQAAYNWLASGMTSIFLQDANSLILPPADLIAILHHLKNRFPWVERITSYARSHTVSRISEADLKAIAEAGLNRIHIGMESGSDAVLKMMKKGTTKARHIRAGLKAKQAGLELSEYIMPGLGGQKLSEVHALETADALNQIDPDFIRIRTLALPENIPLFEELKAGRFDRPSDLMMVREIYQLIEHLKGIRSTIVSDHMLNMFQEVEGTLPQDKEKMLSVLRNFLEMAPEEQCLYQVGRRLGFFTYLHDLKDPELRRMAEQRRDKLAVTPDSVDRVLHEATKRFV